MAQETTPQRVKTPSGTLETADFTIEDMIASFDGPEQSPILDEDCAAGLHSWIGAVGKLPPDTPCARCGEPYGDPE